MTKEEVQQAREMGELTQSVKSTNAIMIRIEDKLDSAISLVGNHAETIAKLTNIVSTSSGRLEYIEEVLEGRKAKNGGILWKINELDRYKEEQCKLQEENRKGWKDILFKSIQWIIMAIMGIILGYHELKNR